MEFIELCESIKDRPFDYVYLKRKRKFTMGSTDVKYGAGEQTEFSVVLSPNGLENQYPLMDIQLHSIGKMKPIVTEYKNEYFSLADKDLQSKISEDTAKKIVDLVNIFLEMEDWYLSDADAYKCLK